MNTAKFIKETSVIDPDIQAEVHITVFKHNESGGLFAIDSSYLDGFSEDNRGIVIQDPFNEGRVLLQRI